MKNLYNKKTKEELEAELEKENFSRITLSFYKYVVVKNPKSFRDKLYLKFDEMKCKGRIYVAKEGVNAQMNVPENNFKRFDDFIQSLPELSGVPYKIAREEKGYSSFKKLKIKVREKIVADGIDDKTFDPSKTGKYMNAEQVNNAIEDKDFLVVDMRNRYEAEVGKFKNAYIMNVDTFKEQLEKVEDELGEKKDKKILMYCTGGIRCEKASALFKHKGFSDVYHIKGGIIDYDKQIKEQGLENKFRGTNFVFDERMGEKISDEIVGICHICKKEETDKYFDCVNKNCPALFIACKKCIEKYQGSCGKRCMIENKSPKWLEKIIQRKNKKRFLFK